MAGKPAPGFAKRPDYALAIAPAEGRMQALLDGAVIADSADAIAMTEQNHDPVFYFPRGDVRMDRLTRTGHDTFCTFKGHASYWTTEAGGRREENVAWSYEAPYDEIREITGMIALYQDRMKLEVL